MPRSYDDLKLMLLGSALVLIAIALAVMEISAAIVFLLVGGWLVVYGFLLSPEQEKGEEPEDDP